MREWLIITLLTPPAVTTLMMVLLRVPLQRFQRQVPEIQVPEDLSRLRKIVSVQMYAALASLILAPIPVLVWVYGHFVAGRLGWLDLPLYVLAPFILMGLATAMMGGPANDVRAIPAATPSLQVERDHIIDVWLNRIFPDW